MRTITTIVAALALTLAFAATAIAQSSLDGYNDRAGQVQSDVGQGGGGSDEGGTAPVSTTSDSGGSLPFTGLDIGLLVAAGALLGAAGYGMRRLTRAPDPA
jgi:hypothetical protein